MFVCVYIEGGPQEVPRTALSPKVTKPGEFGQLGDDDDDDDDDGDDDDDDSDDDVIIPSSSSSSSPS